MRLPVLVAGLLALSACSRGETIIEGTLLDADAAASVWISGGTGRASVEGGSFRLQSATGDTIDLLFGDDEDSAARMRLIGLPPGAHLTLHDVWIEDGVAFPSVVDRDGSTPIAINGIRMGGADALGGEVSARGTLLAMSSEEDRLMVRPDDSGMPDLRVLVTAGANVRSVDGDPVDLDRVAVGDSLEVRGAVENGYVLATELVVARRVAAGVPEIELLGVPVGEPEPRRDDDDREHGDRVQGAERSDEDNRGRGQRKGRGGRPGLGRGRN